MKKKLTILLLVLMLVAAVLPIKLMRLEVINKSDAPAFIKLQEIVLGEPGLFYFLPVQESGGALPSVALFTLGRGFYEAEVWYCNLSVPTHFIFDFSKSSFRITIPPCGAKPQPGGERSVKLNPNLWPAVDILGDPILYDLSDVQWEFRY